jgi:phosphate transport system substrate-binding protein
METKKAGAGLIVALLGVLLFAGCTNTNEEAAQKITLSVSGSTTVQPIAAKAAEKYVEEKSNVVVSVQGGGSGTGIKMVAEGSADIGTSSRELSSEEMAANPELKAYEVAADGIAVIVHPSNTLTDLTDKRHILRQDNQLQRTGRT